MERGREDVFPSSHSICAFLFLYISAAIAAQQHEVRLRKAVRLLSACGERRDRAQLTAPFPKEQETEDFHSKNSHPVFFQGGQTPVQQQAPSSLLRQAEGWEKAVPAWTPEAWSPAKVGDGDIPPGHGDTPPGYGDTHQDTGTPLLQLPAPLAATHVPTQQECGAWPVAFCVRKASPEPS